MTYLHWDFRASAGSVVEATINRTANVLLLTDAEYANFQQGNAYRYHGGHYLTSLIRIAVPYNASWHVVIFPGPVTASVRVI